MQGSNSRPYIKLNVRPYHYTEAYQVSIAISLDTIPVAVYDKAPGRVICQLIILIIHYHDAASLRPPSTSYHHHTLNSSSHPCLQWHPEAPLLSFFFPFVSYLFY